MDLVTALEKAAMDGAGGISFIGKDNSERRLSYSNLFLQARSILNGLHEKGLHTGDELIIQLEDNKDFLSVFWACIIGRIIPVPLSAGPKAELKDKLSGIWQTLLHPFLLCDEDNGTDQDPVIDRWCLFQEIDTTTPALHLPRIEEHDIAYLQFSSGSTGDPKGVTLTHENLLVNISDIIQSLGITQKDKLLSWMPLTHDMGMIGFHLTGVVKGIDQVCIPTSLFIRRPLIWTETIRSFRASVLYSTNFGFQYFLSAFSRKEGHTPDLSSVRIIVNGAEPISIPLCQSFTATLRPYGLTENAILPAYGLAEASVEVAVSPLHQPMRYHSLNRHRLKTGDQVQLEQETTPLAVLFADTGYPVNDCRLRICDDKDNPLPENTIGHIQIQGRNVTNGYYNNARATQDLFTTDHWLRTGDLGFVREGRLVVTGRAKNIIIINGQNYYPQDIEHIIQVAGIAEPGKMAACAIVDPTTGDEDLGLFLLHKGSYENFLSIAKTASDRIYSRTGIRTSKIFPVRKIPKTTSGKVRHFIFQEQFEQGAFDEWLAFIKNFQSKNDTIGVNDHASVHQLIDICRELLGDDHIDDQTDLFDLGLNSIVAMQLTARISRLTGSQVPIDLIFSTRTIQSLYHHLNTPGGDAYPLLIPSAADPLGFELSAAQKRIWIEYQLNAGSSAYNIPIAFDIQGYLDERSLEAAFRYLIGKYEILRTAFELEEDQTIQHPYPYNDSLFSLRRIDLRGIADAQNGITSLFQKEANIAFQLERPTQLRLISVRTDESKFALLFVIHHILIDGWSVHLLLQELSEVYNLLLEDRPIPLPETPPIQFRDYTTWQKKLLGSRLLEKQKNYWSAQLDHSPIAHGLFTGMETSGRDTLIHVKDYDHPFSRTAFDMLMELSRTFETTPFVILMSLLNMLLYRYTGKSDILTGFDTTGRISEEMEQMIGYTLNTLCLRIKLTGQESFRDTVAAVGKKIHEALDNQLYPFEYLLADRNDLGNPYFKVLVLYQGFQTGEYVPAFKGCRIKVQPISVEDGFTDLLLEFTENDEGLNLSIRYNVALYTAPIIERFVLHFDNLLNAVSADMDGKLADYDILRDEKKIFLQDHRPSFNIKRLHLPVQKIFEDRAAASPDTIAIYCGTRQLSYRELNQTANRIAHHLIQAWEVRPGDLVGCMVARSENIVVSILAILKTGAAYVAMDPEMPVARCAAIIDDSRIKCLLTDDTLFGILQQAALPSPLINVSDKQLFSTLPVANPAYLAPMSDPAYVIYTSGSTGRPKGIMIEHASLTTYVQHFIHYFRITDRDRIIQQSSVGFDTLIEELFPALCVGASILISPQAARDIDSLLSLIANGKATILSTTPLVIHALNALASDRLSSLRLIISGGDRLYPHHIDHLWGQLDIYNTYGPSEATVCVTYQSVDRIENAGIIGKPIAGSAIYILDEHRQLMPMGCIGEIYIKGNLARGYLNLPELTASSFLTDPFDREGQLYRSGDLGRWTPSGELEFMGRKDTRPKIGGYRIELEEIEKVISRYGSVSVAAVITDTESKHLIACITTKDDFSIDRLRLHLSKELPYYMIPHHLIVVEHFPLTASGKIDRILLQQEMTRHMRPEANEHPGNDLPRTEMERTLIILYKELLHKGTVKITDHFFELGGDSIKAHQLINKLYLQLGLEIRLSDIFIHPILKDFAFLLETTEEQQYKVIEV